MYEQVFDIINAGQNHKFMVRPSGGGAPMVVHNCLSLQYLTGYRRLHHTAAVWKNPISLEEAKLAHTVYRNTMTGVVAFWEFAEAMLRYWSGEGSFPEHDSNLAVVDGEWVLAGCNAIKVIEDGFQFPNGYRIHYPEMKFKAGRGMGTGFSYFNANKRSRLRAHPGLILEQLSQGSSTQVIDWQQEMVEKELEGTSAVFCGSVHDELIYTCKPMDTAKVKSALFKWMHRSPPWWPEAVFGCEGGTGHCAIEGSEIIRSRYGAAK